MKDFFDKHAKEYDTIWENVSSLANIDYLKYAKKYGIKRRIIHCHNSQNMDSFLRGLLHRFNKPFISKYATDFWSCSNEASSWFYSKKIIDSDKYLLVHNAIDTDKFRFNKTVRDEYKKQLGLENKLVIGNIGRFHFQKNHPFIIKVFNEIYKQNKDSELLLIGTGPDEDAIKQTVKELDLENCVRFLGARDDVPNLMQVMDVFLFPSVFEGLPVVLVEAQTAGLKIYTSKGKITDEVILDKENVKFISLEDGEIEWSKQILEENVNPGNRLERYKLVQDAGYDIKIEAKKLEEIFSN